MSYLPNTIEKIRFELSRTSNRPLYRLERTNKYREFRRRVANGIFRQLESLATRENIAQITQTLKIDQDFNTRLANLMVSLEKFYSADEIGQYLLFAGNYGGQEIINQLGLQSNFELKSPEIMKSLRDHANLLINLVDETTRDRIAEELVKGLEEGLTNDQLVDRLMSIDVVKSISRIRAELIAHAESVNAITRVELEAAKRNGFTEKKWITAHDDRVSEGCRWNEQRSEGWVAIDYALLSPFDRSAHERPPRHPRCRCYLDYNFDTRISFKELWNG